MRLQAPGHVAYATTGLRPPSTADEKPSEAEEVAGQKWKMFRSKFKG
jgi:hypothetical protein